MKEEIEEKRGQKNGWKNMTMLVVMVVGGGGGDVL